MQLQLFGILEAAGIASRVVVSVLVIGFFLQLFRQKVNVLVAPLADPAEAGLLFLRAGGLRSNLLLRSLLDLLLQSGLGT